MVKKTLKARDVGRLENIAATPMIGGGGPGYPCVSSYLAACGESCDARTARM